MDGIVLGLFMIIIISSVLYLIYNLIPDKEPPPTSNTIFHVTTKGWTDKGMNFDYDTNKDFLKSIKSGSKLQFTGVKSIGSSDPPVPYSLIYTVTDVKNVYKGPTFIRFKIRRPISDVFIKLSVPYGVTIPSIMNGAITATVILS